MADADDWTAWTRRFDFSFSLHTGEMLDALCERWKCSREDCVGLLLEQLWARMDREGGGLEDEEGRARIQAEMEAIAGDFEPGEDAHSYLMRALIIQEHAKG